MENKFADARKLMRKTFRADMSSGSTYDAYASTVAMLLFDRFSGADFREPTIRNEAAGAILDLVFGLTEKD